MTARLALPLGSSAFWRRPLEDRMADLSLLREDERLPDADIGNLYTGGRDQFTAVLRFEDVVEVSRDPLTYCSGQGSNAVADMPDDLREYFGSFIAMDDPRHARQRGVVARSFTPRRLTRLLDAVSRTCDEVIDGFCEQGEVDLVQALSAPFPLLIVCDLMGVPRSQFRTVLEATNTILGSGDPAFLGGSDVVTALLDAGRMLTELMVELAELRRRDPADDLTTALVHAGADEEILAPDEVGRFFILLLTAGNDTTRNALSLGLDLLRRHPEARRQWQDALDRHTSTAVEEIVRLTSPVTFMRRTVTTPTSLGGREFEAGDRLVLFYGAANRDPREFEDPDAFVLERSPNHHLGFGGPGPHFCLGAHLARRELAVAFTKLFSRLPDIEVTADPTYLQSSGIPLVSGVKHLPVRFTPQAPGA